jgi:beta-glucosidase
MITEAADMVKRCDVVVLFLGLPGEYEAEGRDRSTIDLPVEQLALVEALRETGTSVIVAMSNGSAVTTAAWRGSVSAIVEFWLTGQAHGDTVADVLFGDANPGGRLAETIPLRLEDTPAYLNFPGEYENVTYGEGIYIGYRYYDARNIAVDFPFGHGLSYTTFSYSDLEIKVRPLTDPIAFDATVTIRNAGQRQGSEVVQLYVHDHSDFVIMPPLELRGWKKITLSPGEATSVEIPVARDHIQHWHDGSKSWIFPGGAVTVYVGASSRDLRLEQTVEIPGAPLKMSLNAWSTLGEWLDHPELGPRLVDLFNARGGVKGRVGDLLADEAGQDSVRGIPLGTIAEFPGVPLEMSDIESLCDKAA